MVVDARAGTLEFDLDGCVSRYMVEQPHARIVHEEDAIEVLTLVLHIASHSYWVQIGKRDTAPATFQIWQITNEEKRTQYRQWRDHLADAGWRPTFRASALLVSEFPTRNHTPIAPPPERNGKPNHQHKFT